MQTAPPFLAAWRLRAVTFSPRLAAMCQNPGSGAAYFGVVGDGAPPSRSRMMN